jgi:hypothetical protein
MAGYQVMGSSGGSSVKTVVSMGVAASSPQRAAVSSAYMGGTTVASAAFIWALQRLTAAGTGTSFTPTQDDPADAASTCTGQIALSVDPTLTANAFELWVPLYQNNSFRWVAENDRQRKMVPATASNGMALIVTVATTTILGGGIGFEQQ